MKSFILFLQETDLSLIQRYKVRDWISDREYVPPRTFNDPDYHPIGVGSHVFKPPDLIKGPINVVDYGGNFGNAINKYAKSKKHQLSSHIFDRNNQNIPGSVHDGPEHKDTVRIIPFETEAIKPHPDLIEHLDGHGYDIHDFSEGLAIKRGKTNPERIGKILRRTEPIDYDTPKGHPRRDIRSYSGQEWEDMSFERQKWITATHHFEQSRELHSLSKTHEIMISKDPFHIAEQSTGKRTWDSCLRLPDGHCDFGGSNHEHLQSDILSGTHVAYLIPKESYKPGKPLSAIARMTLRQYDNDDDGEKHSVLRPAGDVFGYGQTHPVSHAFRSSLRGFTETHFPFHPKRKTYHAESTSPEGNRIYLDRGTERTIHNPT
jgi:hypothetical protein